jgi:hypothetical protein
MKNIFLWIKNNPNRAMFLVPIFLVAGISISHVVSWYELSNPLSWSIYLSIAIEIGAMTALVAATNRIKGGVWIMFGLVTFIQIIGNIFYSYKQIDSNGQLFKSWVELTLPIWEMLGSDTTDIIALKRWLAFLEGGLLPIISLTSLHFFIKYNDSMSKNITEVIIDKKPTQNNDIPIVNDEKELIVENVIVETEPEIEETIVEEESKNEVVVTTENEITPVYDFSTTTTTTDGVRRLNYTKPGIN